MDKDIPFFLLIKEMDSLLMTISNSNQSGNMLLCNLWSK